MLNYIGLLVNGPPGTAGLPFVQSSDSGPICNIALGPARRRHYGAPCEKSK